VKPSWSDQLGPIVWPGGAGKLTVQSLAPTASLTGISKVPVATLPFHPKDVPERVPIVIESGITEDGGRMGGVLNVKLTVKAVVPCGAEPGDTTLIVPT